MSLLNKKVIIPIVLFFLVFSIYFSTGRFIGGDSYFTFHLSKSILEERNIDLDEYQDIINKNKQDIGYSIINIGKHQYSLYPYGTSLIIAPLIYLNDKFASVNSPLKINDILFPDNLDLNNRLYAAFFTTLSAIIIFFIAYKSLSIAKSILVTFIYAFCTMVWASGSAGMNQHVLTVVVFSLSLLITLSLNKANIYFPLLGTILAIGYLIRPSNIIALVVFACFIYVKYQKNFLIFLIPIILVLSVFFAFNLNNLHMLLPPYYLPNTINMKPGNFSGIALIGQIFSPNRGLLIFSPILIFSVIAVVQKLYKNKIDLLDISLITIITFYWVVISSYPQWWAGWSYGPRLFTDMMPFFVYLSIPLFKKSNHLLSQKYLKVLFACLLIFSFLVQYKGATSRKVLGWNSSPENVDIKPSRVWDWQDIQFLR